MVKLKILIFITFYILLLVEVYLRGNADDIIYRISMIQPNISVDFSEILAYDHIKTLLSEDVDQGNLENNKKFRYPDNRPKVLFKNNLFENVACLTVPNF